MTIDVLRIPKLVIYDPETGVFTRRVAVHKWHVGDVIGSINKAGYVSTSLDGVRLYLHRAAWAYMMGAWPEKRIDHRDGCRSNNAWLNLRLATNSENLANGVLRSTNRSGFKGVSWDKTKGKWKAEITKNYRTYFLGYYVDPAAAHVRYMETARSLFGEFARSR